MKRKLTYWVSECLTDSRCYNRRARTRKELFSSLRAEGFVQGNDKRRYRPAEHDQPQWDQVHSVTIEYKDTFDLMDQCLGEGSICEAHPDSPGRVENSAD